MSVVRRRVSLSRDWDVVNKYRGGGWVWNASMSPVARYAAEVPS